MAPAIAPIFVLYLLSPKKTEILLARWTSIETSTTTMAKTLALHYEISNYLQRLYYGNISVLGQTPEQNFTMRAATSQQTRCRCSRRRHRKRANRRLVGDLSPTAANSVTLGTTEDMDVTVWGSVGWEALRNGNIEYKNIRVDTRTHVVLLFWRK